jgi:hypothetical protein
VDKHDREDRRQHACRSAGSEWRVKEPCGGTLKRAIAAAATRNTSARNVTVFWTRSFASRGAVNFAPKKSRNITAEIEPLSFSLGRAHADIESPLHETIIGRAE